MKPSVFFDQVRGHLFAGSLTQGQVDGINAVLAEGIRRKLDLRWLAYILATVYHETARHMLPVIETRQPNEDSNPSVDEAIRRLDRAWAAGRLRWVKQPYWRKDAAGQSWLGRGLPMLTHRENYARAEAKTGRPFLARPELMLELEPAVEVCFRGMLEGWFTGRELADYFDAERSDFYHARQIVNGLDRAADVADYARKFGTALAAAGYRPGVSTVDDLGLERHAELDPVPPPPDVEPPRSGARPAPWWLALLRFLLNLTTKGRSS